MIIEHLLKPNTPCLSIRHTYSVHSRAFGLNMTLLSAQELLRAKEKVVAERDDLVAKLEQAQQELVESKNRITEVEHNLEEANKERMTVSKYA